MAGYLASVEERLRATERGQAATRAKVAEVRKRALMTVVALRVTLLLGAAILNLRRWQVNRRAEEVRTRAEIERAVVEAKPEALRLQE